MARSWWDDGGHVAGAVAAGITVGLMLTIVTALWCAAKRVWRPPTHHRGFLRVNLSGGMRTARYIWSVMLLCALAGVTFMGADLLDGVFSIVVGVLMVLVACFISAVVLWLSRPLATIELDADAGVMRCVLAVRQRSIGRVLTRTPASPVPHAAVSTAATRGITTSSHQRWCGTGHCAAFAASILSRTLPPPPRPLCFRGGRTHALRVLTRFARVQLHGVPPAGRPQRAPGVAAQRARDVSGGN